MRSRIVVRRVIGAVVAVAAACVGPHVAPAHASPASPMSSESIYSTVGDLTSSGPRATGSPGGRRAADYVAQRFQAAGLSDVHFEEVTSYDWTPSNYGLRVGDTPIDAFPVSHSFIPADAGAGHRSTGMTGLTAPVADIGNGKVAGHDVRGKIVLFDLDFLLPTAGMLPLAEYINDPGNSRFDPETMLAANPYLTSLESTVREAQQAGAVGFVGVLDDYFDSNRYHNEYYRRLAMTIPGMWVTRADGARMREMLARQGNRARIDLTVDRRAVTARTVVGMLAGRTRDTVMVQSHHDSVTTGAVEDGTGTAEVIALADHYGAAARRPGYRPRDKSLMFVTFDSHFTGYQSHQAFVDKYLVRRATPWNIVANTTIEHVGRHAKRAANGRLITTDQPEPKGIFENVNLALKADMARSLSRNDVRAATMLNAAPFQYTGGGVPTDASFALVAGIPVVSFIAGPLYMYDDADTLDKVDRSQLAPVAAFFADTLDRLDAQPSRSIGLVPR
ncbi:M28 family peptidase [Gordonia sp. DT30]|uniref:M28 family peptidase n=1 Tax=unclassified Gordonia (in: high G+C Gram-positive bacteria) TaxID=2657482 RepID=UPI003CE6C669